MQHAKRSKKRKPFAAAAGILIAGSAAFATTNWAIGLSGNSYGDSRSANVSNLTVTAVASPSVHQLYPGGSGAVALSIDNPNPFPVTITAIELPTDATFATGYTTSTLSTTQAGCLASTPSAVIWSGSTAVSGSSHLLTTSLTVAAHGEANNPLVVTVADGASMLAAAPSACAASYFAMPPLMGIAATGGTATPTASPVTDSWTN